MTSHKNWAVLLKLQDFEALVGEVSVSYVFEGSSYITGAAAVYLKSSVSTYMASGHGAVLSVHVVMRTELGS